MNNDLLINNILSKIKFKIQPNQNIRKEYLYRIKKKFSKLLKIEKKFINSNTIFNNVESSDLNTINQLSLIDTMSRISIGFIVNQICKNLKPDAVYINVGVWRGFTLFAGMINTDCEVHGVDNFSFDYEDGDSTLNNKSEEIKAREYFFKNFNKIRRKEKHFFYDMGYRNFFKLWEKKNKHIDFYYYDGEHSYKNQYDNLVIADNFLRKGSVIMVDDYNGIDVERATLDFLSKFKSNYKIIKEIKTANMDIHPSYANGIILIEKIN